MMRLLESKKTDEKKGRSAGGTISSIILHVLVIFLAVFATARAGTRKTENRTEKVRFITMKKDQPPPPPKKEPPPPPKVKEPPKPKTPEPPKLKIERPKIEQPKVEAPAPPKGFQVLPPPVNVPSKIPAIDLSKALTNENDFSGKGIAGGTANGVKGGTGDADSKGKEAGEVKKPEEEHHGPYMEFQVEKPVERIGGDSPEYPASLKDSGVEGSVIVQFVVNESGRYESGTLKVLSSSNPAFTAAVKEALPRMKFSAAQIGGKKVQQLVQMPFQFHLQR